MSIKYLHNDPVLMIKLSDCKIQNGFDKIVHPINLSSIEQNVLLITKIIRQLDSSLPIAQLATEKSRALINNLRQVKPYNPRRKRRWDTLGSAWKWLAGSPDADDLRLINTTMNELIEQNNQQFIINKMVNERIDDVTKAVNNIIKQQNMENKILIEEYDTITLLLYMDTLNNVLEEIQDTILRSKIALPNNKIITLKEILLIEALLREQGIKLDFPEQALNYVTPKIATKGDMMYYILQTPRLQRLKAEVIQIFPLIVNNTTILHTAQYLVKIGNDFFQTNNPSEFIQKLPDLVPLNDECLLPIMKGTESSCNATRKTNSQVLMITDNKLLINNGFNHLIHSDCGPQNRTLTGNFLITFNNCTLDINGEKFSSREFSTNKSLEIDGAFANLKITLSLTEHKDINEIHNNTIWNRNRMQLISFEQDKQHIWIKSLLSGLSTTAIIMIGIIIYICVRKRKVILKVRLPKKGLIQQNQAVIMDEDAHSSPPGGVTSP